MPEGGERLRNTLMLQVLREKEVEDGYEGGVREGTRQLDKNEARRVRVSKHARWECRSEHGGGGGGGWVCGGVDDG